MKANLPCLAVIATVIGINVTNAYGKRIAPPPASIRAATADCVIVGEVTRLEPKAVLAFPHPGAPKKVEHLIAVVKIDSAIHSAKGLTHLRIGYVGQTGKVRGGSAFPSVGEKALFFVNPCPGESFYLARTYFDVILQKNNTAFAKQVKEAKDAARLLADTKKGLQSKIAEERYLTAALLLTKYRTPTATATQLGDVDKEESRLILEALAETNWKAPRQYYLNPQSMFYRLGVSKKDGWEQPKDARQFEAEAKKWLKANAKTFALKRFVAPAPSPK